MNAPLRHDLSISPVDWGLICALAAIWGSSFVLAKIAVFEIPAITISFVRIAAAAALLWVLTRMLGHRLPADARGWVPFIPLAIFNNVVPFTLMYWAQLHIPSGLGAILNATTPFFAIAIAAVATTEERITPGRVAGLVAGFTGVIVTVGPDLLHALGANVLAQGAALVAALCFGIGGVYGRRLRAESPWVLATGQLMVSAVILAPLSMLIDRPWTLPMLSAAALWAMVALTLFTTMLAYLLFFRILARVGATNVLLVTFLQPVAAIFLGWLAFGEQLTMSQAAGMAGILIGLAAIDGRAARFITSRLGWRRSA